MTDDIQDLQKRLERLNSAERGQVSGDEAKSLLRKFLAMLESGEVRAASKQADGQWVTHAWVKRAIMLCYRWGDLTDYSINDWFQFADKDTLPPQNLKGRANPPRVVPGGTTVRSGVYIGRNVIIAPPSFVNIGAYVDDETMIDSHALVASCAQIGKRVHLSAGVLTGGVIEPPSARPVVIEDDVFVGANCGVFEGTLVRKGAVLGAGAVLTQSTPVYDLVREQIYRAQNDRPLEIPEYAVVVPGARSAGSAFAQEHGLSYQTPIIVRYRRPGEQASLALEPELR